MPRWVPLYVHRTTTHSPSATEFSVISLAAHEWEAAWHDYENFLTVGGVGLPPTAWLDFCSMLEARQEFERALSEYENLAVIHPSERQRLLALLGAARICLNRLNRPQDALRFYEAASASAVPHLDLERDIESGIREAKIAIAFRGWFT